MKNLKFEFKIKTAFWNLRRDRTVVIIVKNSKGEFLMGSKPSFYPPTITRLMGGGVRKEENPLTAAQRELGEEMGVELGLEEFEHVLTMQIKAVDEESEVYNTQIYLVKVLNPVDEYSPGDDVQIIGSLNLAEMENLINSYRELSENLWCKGEEGEFCWNDYGKVYAEVHALATKM